MFLWNNVLKEDFFLPDTELLLADLQNLTAFPDTREDKYGDINTYFKDWYNHQVRKEQFK